LRLDHAFREESTQLKLIATGTFCRRCSNRKSGGKRLSEDAIMLAWLLGQAGEASLAGLF
jgi:hypothetical protein